MIINMVGLELRITIPIGEINKSSAVYYEVPLSDQFTNDNKQASLFEWRVNFTLASWPEHA